MTFDNISKYYTPYIQLNGGMRAITESKRLIYMKRRQLCRIPQNIENATLQIIFHSIAVLIPNLYAEHDSAGKKCMLSKVPAP